MKKILLLLLGGKVKMAEKLFNLNDTLQGVLQLPGKTLQAFSVYWPLASRHWSANIQ